jgi:dihydrofolate reductase
MGEIVSFSPLFSKSSLDGRDYCARDFTLHTARFLFHTRRREPQPADFLPKPIHIILAVARNGAIGLQGRLPWKLPEEWQYFLATTRGGILIHGRQSQDHHGAALPEREVIVLSRNPNYVPPPGAKLARSLTEALRAAQESPHPGPIWIGGGPEIYRESLPLADRVYLTEIYADFAADTFLPWEIFAQAGFTRVLSAQAGPPGAIRYVCKILAREQPPSN